MSTNNWTSTSLPALAQSGWTWLVSGGLAAAVLAFWVIVKKAAAKAFLDWLKKGFGWLLKSLFGKNTSGEGTPKAEGTVQSGLGNGHTQTQTVVSGGKNRVTNAYNGGIAIGTSGDVIVQQPASQPSLSPVLAPVASPSSALTRDPSVCAQCSNFEVINPRTHADIWGQFEGNYYAWNPTWNYERSSEQGVANAMLKAHKTRMLNPKLLSISYVLTDPTIVSPKPLKAGFQETKVFFSNWLRNKAPDELRHGWDKFKIFAPTQAIISRALKAEWDISLLYSISFFLGDLPNVGGAPKTGMLLFLNNPMFMDAFGTHDDGYLKRDGNAPLRCSEFLKQIIQQCHDDHKDGNTLIYSVNPIDGALVAWKP